MVADTAYTLLQLNEFIRRVLALNLPDPVWVKAEVAQISRSRGHIYLTLLQQEDPGGEPVAQSEAVIWNNACRQLQRRLGPTLEGILQEGMQLLLQVRVSYHERYGLKLHVENLDETYTLGKWELQRQQTIDLLRRLGLLEKNRALTLPPVLQRIAVISSPNAAGWQDFKDQLEQNAYGYRYVLRLFPAAMQGNQAAVEVQQQLAVISRLSRQFDCIVLIRGGGARLDLAAFDNLALNQELANAPLPLLTGIGHETDQSVADLVAARALKTPTAVAEFLISHNLAFEQSLVEGGQFLQMSAGRRLEAEKLRISRLCQQVQLQSQAMLNRQSRLLEYIRTELPALSALHLRTASRQLDLLENISELLAVEKTLARGFTITTHLGSPLRSGADLKTGDELMTRFADGEVKSAVVSDRTQQR